MKKETKKIEDAIVLVRNGHSYRKAAEAVGLHWTTVTRWCKRAGIKSEHTMKLELARPSLLERIKKWFR